VKATLCGLAAVLAAASLIAAGARPANGRRDVGDCIASADAYPSEENLAVCRRAEWRVEAVADLLSGRLTAAETHARFLDANRSDSRAIRSLRIEFPGSTDEERTARQLVRYLWASGHPRAEEVAAAVRREWFGPRHPVPRLTNTDAAAAR
jgi:hypothetical protein